MKAEHKMKKRKSFKIQFIGFCSLGKSKSVGMSYVWFQIQILFENLNDSAPKIKTIGSFAHQQGEVLRDYKQNDLNNPKQFYSTLKMNTSKTGILLLATLLLSAFALRAPHLTLHLQNKATPQSIQPLVYNPNQPYYAPTPNTPQPNPPSSQPVATTQPQNNPQPAGQTSIQPPQNNGVPNSIAPLPFPASCSNGKVWNQAVLNCVCPADKPNLDGTDKCINCENGQTFNAKTIKCECQGDNFDDGTGKCVSCPSPDSWDLKNKKCVRCPEGLTFDKSTSLCACPKEKPYLDASNSCQSCNGDWDAASFTCKACETNTTWNPTSKKCECQGENFLDSANKCIACPKPAAWDLTNKKCVRCPEGFVFDQKTSQCACPPEKPYLDASNNCQACATKWDATTFKCLVCDFGTAWNAATQKCEPKCPYPLVGGKCQCPLEKPLLDQATQECKECAKENPAWNGKQCKACPAGSNYVAWSKSCITCVDGTKFNQANQSCQPSA